MNRLYSTETSPRRAPRLRGRTRIALVVAGAIAGAAACESEGLGPGDVAVVTIEPTAAELSVGESTSFTATVSRTSNTAVTWAASCGVVAGQGLTVDYTAPWEPGECTLTVTSAATPTSQAEAVIQVTPLAAEDNLLPNGTFDTDLDGWNIVVDGESPRATWSDEDHLGEAGSGSVESFNTFAGNGALAYGLSLCLPAVPQARYVLGASAKPMQALAGAMPAVRLRGYFDECLADASDFQQQLSFDPLSTEWSSRSVEFTTPPGVTHLFIMVGISKESGVDDTASALFDNLFLVRVD